MSIIIVRYVTVHENTHTHTRFDRQEKQINILIDEQKQSSKTKDITK